MNIYEKKPEKTETLKVKAVRVADAGTLREDIAEREGAVFLIMTEGDIVEAVMSEAEFKAQFRAAKKPKKKTPTKAVESKGAQ